MASFREYYFVSGPLRVVTQDVRNLINSRDPASSGFRHLSNPLDLLDTLGRQLSPSWEARVMKTVTCDRCDATANGASFEDWMKALMPHYMEAHPEVMRDPSGDREKWMIDNKLRFDAIPSDI
jgi:hypothetical protein